MRNFFLLIKNYFNIFVSGFNKKKNKRGSIISGGALLLIIGLIFILLFSSTAYTTISEIKKDPETDIEVALYALSSIGLVFLLLIIIMKGTNSKKANDYELLYSLPIKKSTIILSRVFKELIFDFISLILVMMPGYVIYAFISNADFSYPVILTGILVVFCLALFSSAVSLILKEVIIKLTSKFKYAEIIQTIINVLIMVIFVIFYYWFMNSIQTNGSSTVEFMLRFYPVELMVSFLTLSNFLNILIFILICVVPFIFSIFLSTYLADRQIKKRKIKKEELKYKKTKTINSLIKKEFGKYFRNTNYVINTTMGGFLLIIFGFIIAFLGFDQIKSLINNAMGSAANVFVDNLETIIMLFLILLSSTIVTTSCSISLEGKELWIIKSLPIKIKDVFLSKLILNFIVGIIPIVIAAFLISLKVGFIYFVPLLFICILGLIYAAVNGLNLNLKYPKLDYQDEVEVIKQSMSVLLSLVTSLIPGIMCLIIYFSLLIKLPLLLSLLIIFVIYLIIDAIEIIILIKKGPKYLNNINN